MSVAAPPPLFERDNTNLIPPLGDGWEHATNLECRPWRVLVFNLALSDFCGTPDCLADLAYADCFGERIRNAGDVGAILGLLVTLPGEVKARPGRDAPSLSATFKECNDAVPMLKTQLVLEVLRSPLEPFTLVGLRIHVLLYDHARDSHRFPTLTSAIWQAVLDQNDARRRKAAKARARPPPVSEDPALASRSVASMATLGKIWKGVLQNEVTATQRTLAQWTSKSAASVSNVGFRDAVYTQYKQLWFHYLSPEMLLRLSPETLLLRAPIETAAEQLDVSNYFDEGAETYRFPTGEVFIFAGDMQCLHSPFPRRLSNEIMQAHEEYGGAGQSFSGSAHTSSGASVRFNRKRNRDLLVDTDESGESESE